MSGNLITRTVKINKATGRDKGFISRASKINWKFILSIDLWHISHHTPYLGSAGGGGGGESNCFCFRLLI